MPRRKVQLSKSLRALRQGHNGKGVMQLQTMLQDLGYGGRVDGDFGRATVAMVVKFQSLHGLMVDGVVGPETKAALNREHTRWEAGDDAFSFAEVEAKQAEEYEKMLADEAARIRETGRFFP